MFDLPKTSNSADSMSAFSKHGDSEHDVMMSSDPGRFRTVYGFFRLVKPLNVPEFLGMNLYDKLSGI